MLYSEFEPKIKKHKQMMNIYLITIADYIFEFFQCVIFGYFCVDFDQRCESITSLIYLTGV